jgi:hypothetical protein
MDGLPQAATMATGQSRGTFKGASMHAGLEEEIPQGDPYLVILDGGRDGTGPLPVDHVNVVE